MCHVDRICGPQQDDKSFRSIFIIIKTKCVLQLDVVQRSELEELKQRIQHTLAAVKRTQNKRRISVILRLQYKKKKTRVLKFKTFLNNTI